MFIVEISNTQEMQVNSVIFLIFSYSLDYPKLFVSVPTKELCVK